MHVVYVLLAERLGWPIHGVTVKDHLFCRWDDGEYRANIEGTARGAAPTDEQYIEDFKVTPEELATTVFMKSLTRKQMLGQLLFHRSMYWIAVGRSDRGMEDLQLAVNVPGVDPYVHNNLALLQRGEMQRILNEFAQLKESRRSRMPDPTGFSGAPDPVADMRREMDKAMSDPLHYLNRDLQRNDPGNTPTPQPGAPPPPPSHSPGNHQHPALNDPLYYTRQHRRNPGP